MRKKLNQLKQLRQRIIDVQTEFTGQQEVFSILVDTYRSCDKAVKRLEKFIKNNPTATVDDAADEYDDSPTAA